MKSNEERIKELEEENAQLRALVASLRKKLEPLAKPRRYDWENDHLPYAEDDFRDK